MVISLCVCLCFFFGAFGGYVVIEWGVTVSCFDPLFVYVAVFEDSSYMQMLASPTFLLSISFGFSVFFRAPRVGWKDSMGYPDH